MSHYTQFFFLKAYLTWYLRVGLSKTADNLPLRLGLRVGLGFRPYHDNDKNEKRHSVLIELDIEADNLVFGQKPFFFFIFKSEKIQMRQISLVHTVS